MLLCAYRLTLSQGVGPGVGASVDGCGASVGGSVEGGASVVACVVLRVVLRVVERVVLLVVERVVDRVVVLVRRLVDELCVAEELLVSVMPFSSYSAEGSSVVVSVASELLETLRSKAVVFALAVVAAASSAARL